MSASRPPLLLALLYPHRDGIQPLVRAAFWSGTVREAQQLLLGEGVEHLDRGPLDDFVFQRRLA